MSTHALPRRYHHGDLRAALLEVAEQSLRERGAGQLSLRDLAREIGVSHAAPRRHFTERQDLLDALARAGFIRLGERIDGAIAAASDLLTDQLHGAASAFAHFATENAALLELMNATKHRGDSPDAARASDAAFAPIVGLIRESQVQHVLRAGPPEEIGFILYATINGIATMVNSGLVDADRLEELTDIAVDQFLRGAAP